MAASRARPSRTDPPADPLIAAAQRTLQAARGHGAAESESAGRLLSSGSRRRSGRVAPLTVVVGYSGGADSTALLHVLAALARQRGTDVREVVAVHVHHGLSRHADEWLAHCEQQAQTLGVRFVARRVTPVRAGRGIEAAARTSRYEALADTAAELRADAICVAQHRDDRIETFLIQWMRGAGPEGLAAFAPIRRFGTDGGPLLLRPFIDVARADIDEYVERHGLPFVEDDSNEDRTLLRNALRLDVLLRLDALRPGFRAAAARSVDLVAEAADALRSFAAQDLALCQDGAPPGMLRLDALALLPAVRQAWALRAWLSTQGVEAPSRVRLLEMLSQVRDARSDSRLLLRVGDREVRRHRGLLLLKEADAAARNAETFRWGGEDEIELPAWRGVLRFVRTAGEGFDPAWLAAEPLEVRLRAGGERFKPSASRPSRTLKRLYQDAGIAEFDRAALPLLWRDGELIFVAGLGADVRLTDRDGERIRIEWRPDATLLEEGD